MSKGYGEEAGSSSRRVRGLGKTTMMAVLVLLVLVGSMHSALAGPFLETWSYGEWREYPRVPMTSADIVGWATGYVSPVNYGTNLWDDWKTPELALGPAAGTSDHVVSLGRGGRITLTFGRPIRDGEGWDFAVFENSFSDDFLELAYVEVSTDGVVFVRFDNVSLTPGPVSGFEGMDYTNVFGLAGKYRAGYGTPFDLSFLAYKAEVQTGLVNLNAINYIRLLDVVGDRTCFDNPPPAWNMAPVPIYDPYPTDQSAGFDLDAVGVRYEGEPGVLAGDVDGNGVVDDTDARIALQVLAGENPAGIRENYPESGADVNGDGRIGMEEVLYILGFK